MIWSLSEVVFTMLLRTKSSDRKNADKGTLIIIWLTIIITIFLSVYIASTYHFPLLNSPIIKYVGIVVIYIGVIFRILAIRSLGKFFTVAVTIREGHRLKKDGFYKYLRHPSYLASLLSFVGLGITLNNWISLAQITIAILFVFIIRINVEEKILIEQFGNEYLEYQKSTKRIIPFIY